MRERRNERDRVRLIIMLGAWALGALMLGVVVWELKQLGLEVSIW